MKHWVGLDQIDSLPELDPSRRRFKFGSRRTFDSLGAIVLTRSPPEASPQSDTRPEILSIQMDVIDLDTPLFGFPRNFVLAQRYDRFLKTYDGDDGREIDGSSPSNFGRTHYFSVDS